VSTGDETPGACAGDLEAPSRSFKAELWAAAPLIKQEVISAAAEYFSVREFMYIV
jgi:hypothetical protein